MQILSYFPGQKVTILLETKTSDGYRANSAILPYISSILSFTSSVDGYTAYDGYLGDDGYNQPFTQISVGLYFAQITLPKTASAVGSYLVNANYINPNNGFPNIETYQLIVNAPFGNFGITAR